MKQSIFNYELLIFIPARSKSKRLKNKNIKTVMGKSLISNAINFSKIQKDLNWRPKYKFDEGINKTINFYINNFQNLKKIF